MKEFIIYRFYMSLIELSKTISLIILSVIFLASYPIVFSNSINMFILFFFIIIIRKIYVIFIRNTFKGKIGEYITRKVIESYSIKRGYGYLNDIMVENDILVTSQIDHIIITRRGIAVIETKFHSGSIYGSEYDNKWTYYIKGFANKKYKKQYGNPLKQNFGHIEALKKVLDKNIQYYNIVLYIDSVDLKKCIVKNRFSGVGYTYNLNEIVEELDKLSEKDHLSSVEIVEARDKILEANIVDKYLRQEHIYRIRAT